VVQVVSVEALFGEAYGNSMQTNIGGTNNMCAMLAAIGCEPSLVVQHLKSSWYGCSPYLREALFGEAYGNSMQTNIGGTNNMCAMLAAIGCEASLVVHHIKSSWYGCSPYSRIVRRQVLAISRLDEV